MKEIVKRSNIVPHIERPPQKGTEGRYVRKRDWAIDESEKQPKTRATQASNALARVLHQVGLNSTAKVRVGRVEVSPRDVVAACLPDPATLGDRMSGKTCAGLWVSGTGLDGQPRKVYLYHVVDNAWSMDEYGSQAVVWQTAINPVIALELLAGGTWQGSGVLGPEAFDAVPFLDLLTAYGSPWGLREGG